MVSPRSLPLKTLTVPANAKTASGENKHLGATTFWRGDSRQAEGNAGVNVSPACMCEVVQKDVLDAENYEGYQEREKKTKILKLSQYCAASELLAYDGNKIKEYA